jgi:hypothetical protein
MEATEHRNCYDRPGVMGGAMDWRVFVQREMNSYAVVQVDDGTPILPSRENSSIHGTRGTVSPDGFTKRSVGMALRLIAAGSTSSRSGEWRSFARVKGATVAPPPG